MSRYIDREALLEWIESVDGCLADGTVTAPTLYAQMITDIKQFPTADVVEVRYGYWFTDYARQPMVVCSNCDLSNNYNRSKYCPHCGAKMDGKRSENGK